uniref:Eka-Trp1 protein n=1 Tax=Euperipatoides kanangrensis TaxID=488523 RepID=A0A0F7VHQ1_9BILA|nr:Eka-Trp1 protein [Euperipatoides kanangrensis]
MLINHPSISCEMLGKGWAPTKTSADESSDYSPDISPVILAAHCNQFEILQLLISRGAVIDKPHSVSCRCSKCQESLRTDSLRYSLLRIHTYRALASPAWISLTSADPILTAFKLSWELERLAMRENEFKDTYIELAMSCKKYACDLLDQCRSSEEVIAVLNKKNDSDSEDDDEDDEDDSSDGERGEDRILTLARLKLALKYEQKQFVAHPNCQQLLTSVWYEGLPGWRRYDGALKILICIGLIFLFPFMAFYYLIFPRSRIGQFLRSPFMKFLYHSTSFGCFLILLVLASTRTEATDGKRERIRGPPPTPVEWLIMLWVTGMVWAECKQLWEEGLKAYIRQWWNWLDFIMLSLYLCTLSLRMVAYIQVQSGKNEYREIERSLWPDNDPTLISEGVFAIANVFSFARIIYLFQTNPHLGPLQISLGCMLIDIAKFLFIFFLILTSFACGLNQLYWYYDSDCSQGKNADGECKMNTDAFTTLDNTFVTLFWSLFGITTPKSTDLHDDHKFIETVGQGLFMAYHVAAIIVLINMLIAMMSNSFQVIEDHADREWKFARSKLWMSYFDEGATLPSPFNVIPSPKSLFYFLRGSKNFICGDFRRKKPKPRRRSMERGTIKRPSQNGSEKSYITKRDPEYQEVMKLLVTRYIHHTKKELRQDGVNEDDLLEIKQDISSLRYELREDRKRESARSSGQVEGIKRDLIRTLRSNGQNWSTASLSAVMPNPCSGSTPIITANPKIPSPINTGPLMPHVHSVSLHSQSDADFLRREIISSLRIEIRELIREIHQSSRNSPIQPPALLPTINSELYHTHLYTQL